MDSVGSKGIILPLKFSMDTRVSCNNEFKVSRGNHPTEVLLKPQGLAD